MANVFAILTAIVLALASFVAYKNKAAYEKEISDTKDRIAELAKSNDRLNTAKTSLAATIEKRKGVDDEVVAQTTKEFNQQKDNKALTEEVAAKKAEFEPKQKQLDDIKQKTEKLGDLKDLASKMNNFKTEVEELKQLIDTANAKLANLTSQNTQTENQVKSSKDKFEKFASGQSLATLKTRLRTIYPTWGFVTLASGNNAGVVTNSTLEVVRDGATIAKLLVTSVESTTASASIIPDSMAQDTVLMVGDKVIASIKAPVVPAAPKHSVVPAQPATPAAKPEAKPDDAGATPDPAATPAATPDAAATPAAGATPDPAATPATPAAETPPAPAPN